MSKISLSEMVDFMETKACFQAISLSREHMFASLNL